MAEHDVEETWEEFWLPILREAEGDPGVAFVEGDYLSVAMLDQIKRELYDYAKLIEGLPEFFMEITGGKVSKPNTKLDVVSDLVHDHIEEQAREYAKEEVEILADDERDAAWQRGYDQAYEEGRAQGREEGLEDARRMIW